MTYKYTIHLIKIIFLTNVKYLLWNQDRCKSFCYSKLCFKVIIAWNRWVVSFSLTYLFLWLCYNHNWVRTFTEKLRNQVLCLSYPHIWIMSKTRDIMHQSKLQRQIVTSSLEILKNREDGHVSWIVKLQSFLEIEASIDNLLTSVQSL